MWLKIILSLELQSWDQKHIINIEESTFCPALFQICTVNTLWAISVCMTFKHMLSPFNVASDGSHLQKALSSVIYISVCAYSSACNSLHVGFFPFKSFQMKIHVNCSHVT